MNLQLSDQPTNPSQTTSNITYQVSLMQFPQPKQTYDSGVVPIFLLAAIMFNFVILAKTLVQEKETRLLEGMKMMGLLEVKERREVVNEVRVKRTSCWAKPWCKRKSPGCWRA